MLRAQPVSDRYFQDQLLKACFGNSDEGRLALESCTEFRDGGLDAASRRLLPILYRRWSASDRNTLIDLAHRTYLTTWRQNRERMSQIAAVLDEFVKAGIECMLLKGAALTLRYYRDYGMRNMNDFDLLIHEADIEPAVDLLLELGWDPDEGCTAKALLRQSRVRHAWQFLKGDSQNCDLHWRPLAQCYSPQVNEMFWRGAETVQLDGQCVKVPCPTDQLFHVCTHAMHWEWTPNLYWVADALAVLREAELNWERATALAVSANMCTRFTRALSTLESQFHQVFPSGVLCMEAPSWEQREYGLLQKPCPLGLFDSIAWHAYHFRRLRPFDKEWCRRAAWVGFLQYLATFLDALTLSSLFAKLWAQLKLRVRKGTSC